MNWLHDLISNPFLIAGVSSWLVAQVLKCFIHFIISREFSIHRLLGDGGMPSGHSATVSSVAVMSALVYGTGSFQFALSIILALIVCHDAMGVRRETGKQAVIIKDLVRVFEVMTSKELPDIKLKEFVGHTPIQVMVGVLLGTLNAFVLHCTIFS